MPWVSTAGEKRAIFSVGGLVIALKAHTPPTPTPQAGPTVYTMNSFFFERTPTSFEADVLHAFEMEQQRTTSLGQKTGGADQCARRPQGSGHTERSQDDPRT
jgi:hypothetical protein